MSGEVGADVDALDAFVRAQAEAIERQRRILRELQRALDAASSATGILTVTPLPADLRRVLERSEALADHVRRSAHALRAADRLLDGLAAPGTTGSSGAGTGMGRGTVLPTPDADFSWHRPTGWAFTRARGDRRAHVEVELGAGLRVDGGAGIDVSREALRLGSFAEARLGSWAAAAAGSALGPFATIGRGQLFVGALARAEGLLHVGRDGARAHVGGEAFAGAKASGDARGGLGPVQVGAEGSIAYGVGVTGQADVDLSLRRIGARLKLGAALGVGIDGGFEYYVEPAWLVDGILDVGDGAVRVGTDVARDTVRTGRDAVGAAVDIGTDAVGAGTGAVGSAVRSVTGWLG